MNLDSVKNHFDIQFRNAATFRSTSNKISKTTFPRFISKKVIALFLHHFLILKKHAALSFHVKFEHCTLDYADSIIPASRKQFKSLQVLYLKIRDKQTEAKDVHIVARREQLLPSAVAKRSSNVIYAT